jgi:hypothetical protein
METAEIHITPPPAVALAADMPSVSARTGSARAPSFSRKLAQADGAPRPPVASSAAAVDATVSAASLSGRCLIETIEPAAPSPRSGTDLTSPPVAASASSGPPRGQVSLGSGPATDRASPPVVASASSGPPRGQVSLGSGPATDLRTTKPCTSSNNVMRSLGPWARRHPWMAGMGVGGVLAVAGGLIAAKVKATTCPAFPYPQAPASWTPERDTSTWQLMRPLDLPLPGCYPNCADMNLEKKDEKYDGFVTLVQSAIYKFQSDPVLGQGFTRSQKNDLKLNITITQSSQTNLQGFSSDSKKIIVLYPYAIANVKEVLPIGKDDRLLSTVVHELMHHFTHREFDRATQNKPYKTEIREGLTSVLENIPFPPEKEANTYAWPISTEPCTGPSTQLWTTKEGQAVNFKQFGQHLIDHFGLEAILKAMGQGDAKALKAVVDYCDGLYAKHLNRDVF